MEAYKKQIPYYNCTVYEVLANEIDLILTTFSRDKRNRRSIIASDISDIIAWNMKAFLVSCTTKNKRPSTKLSRLWEEKADIQHKKIFHLELL